jgi:hypothetical protein
MKATKRNSNCSVLFGEDRRYSLTQKISRIYDDISQCLYDERPDMSTFVGKGKIILKNMHKSEMGVSSS